MKFLGGKVSFLFCYLVLFVSFALLSGFLIVNQGTKNVANQPIKKNMLVLQNSFRNVSFNIVMCENKACPEAAYESVSAELDRLSKIAKSDISDIPPKFFEKISMLKSSFNSLGRFNRTLYVEKNQNIKEKFEELKEVFGALYRKSMVSIEDKKVAHMAGKAFVRVHHLNSLVKDIVNKKDIKYIEEAREEISNIKMSLANISDYQGKNDVSGISSEAFIILEEYSEKIERLSQLFSACKLENCDKTIEILGEISDIIENITAEKNIEHLVATSAKYLEYMVIVVILGLACGLWGMWIFASRGIFDKESVVPIKETKQHEVPEEKISSFIKNAKELINELEKLK